MRKSLILNRLMLPLRLILPHETVNRIKLQSLRDERCDLVMSHCHGRLLDIGCGNNQLVKKYGRNSVGVDVYDSGSNALIVKDASDLPFDDASFQTVSFVASLNHIPNRKSVLKETYRLLGDDGLLLVTMLTPFIGVIRHKLAWWDKDQHERGMKKDELMGMSHKRLIEIMEEQGFKFERRIRFILWMNNLYIYKKI